MAGASKKTTCALATVSILFIIVIIILCLVPDPCRRNDPRERCRPKHLPIDDGDISEQSTTTSTLSTTVKHTSLTKSSESPTTPPSTSSTSSASSSTSTVSSTGSTEGSLLGNATGTTVSETNYTAIVTEESETTTASSEMTSDFGNDTSTDLEDSDYNTTLADVSSTDPTVLDYNTTVADVTSTTLELNETGTATTVTVGSTSTPEMSTTEIFESTLGTDMSTSQTTIVTTLATIRAPKELEETCDTPICKEVARRMLDMMDPREIDPCDDFYQYSCGGILDDLFLKPEDPQLLAENIIKAALADGNRTTSDDDLKNLFRMYDSCLEFGKMGLVDRLEAAKGVFGELGYQFTETSGPGGFNLGEALVKMMGRHYTPFFDIAVDIDNKEETHEFILKMVMPRSSSALTNDRAKEICLNEYTKKVDEAKEYGREINIESEYKAYIDCKGSGKGLEERMANIKRAVKDLNLFENLTDSTLRDKTEQEALDSLKEMLKNLANVIPSEHDVMRADVNKTFEEFSLDSVDDGTALGNLPFKIQDFLETVVVNAKIDDLSVYKLQVNFKNEFIEVFRIIREAFEGREQQMQNVILLLWAEHIYDDLVNPLGAPPGSEDYCFNAVTKHMEDYASLLYLKSLSDKEELDRKSEEDKLDYKMKRMISLTKDVMTTCVENSTLDSLSAIGNKLLSMTGEIATSPERIGRVDMVDDFTENYNILMNKTRKRLYWTYNDLQPNSKEYMTMWKSMQAPFTKTGVTSYYLNKFFIPHGAMSPPYYYEGVPAYINFAGIGHMIAHELLHGFDSTGWKFNGDEEKKMDDDPKLIASTECLADQNMNGLTVGARNSSGFQYRVKLDTSLHQDGLLAESAAPNLAWEAYVADPTYNYTVPTEEPYAYNPRGSVKRRRRSAEGMAISSSSGSGTDEDHRRKLFHREEKSIQQIFFIKMAQNQCSSTSGVDILSIMENQHLPPRFRVNLGLRNNPLFHKAFDCLKKPNPNMVPEDVCFYSPMGYKHKNIGGA